MTGAGRLDPGTAWRLLRALREHAWDGGPCGLALGPDGAAAVTGPDSGDVRVDGGSWNAAVCVEPAAAQLFDLHLPMLRRAALKGVVTVGQLGQSLDGRIATEGGSAQVVNGAANLDHLHRLRALADAVIVGAGTVCADDPQLTTRRVAGPNAVRVVLDPRGRVPADRGLFRDGAAPTLVLSGQEEGPAGAETQTLPVGPDGFAPAAVLAALHARGLRRVLVEGGGVTVSRFLAAGALDRLHVGVAPLFLGSGHPAISLPRIDDLNEALRPEAVRVHAMPPDTLFDCDLQPVSNYTGAW